MLVPAGRIIVNQFCFPFISTSQIIKVKINTLIPVQIKTHAGVECILDIPPAKGLIIKPPIINTMPTLKKSSHKY